MGGVIRATFLLLIFGGATVVLGSVLALALAHGR